MGYLLLPMIMLRVVNLILIIGRFFNEHVTRGVLHFDPFSLYPGRNLREIKDILLFITIYISTPIAMLGFFAFFREALDPLLYNYLFLTNSIFVLFLFLGPLMSVSAAYQNKKEEQLTVHAVRIDALRSHLNVGPDLKDSIETLREYETYYQHLASASLLPVTAKDIATFGAAVGIPILIAILQGFIGQLAPL